MVCPSVVSELVAEGQQAINASLSSASAVS